MGDPDHHERGDHLVGIGNQAIDGQTNCPRINEREAVFEQGEEIGEGDLPAAGFYAPEDEFRSVRDWADDGHEAPGVPVETAAFR